MKLAFITIRWSQTKVSHPLFIDLDDNTTGDGAKFQVFSKDTFSGENFDWVYVKAEIRELKKQTENAPSWDHGDSSHMCDPPKKDDNIVLKKNEMMVRKT